MFEEMAEYAEKRTRDVCKNQVQEMVRMLRLGKTESYWHIQKNYLKLFLSANTQEG